MNVTITKGMKLDTASRSNNCISWPELDCNRII